MGKKTYVTSGVVLGGVMHLYGDIHPLGYNRPKSDRELDHEPLP